MPDATPTGVNARYSAVHISAVVANNINTTPHFLPADSLLSSSECVNIVNTSNASIANTALPAQFRFL